MRAYFFSVLILLLLVFPVFAAAPVANFTGTPLSGAVPLSVQFTDTTGANLFLHSEQFADTPIVSEGLLAEYKFNDTDTTLRDYSGNGNNGVIVNSPSVIPEGLYFNGINQYVTIPYFGLSSKQNYTIQAVFNTTSENINLYSEGNTATSTPLLVYGIYPGGKQYWYQRNDAVSGIQDTSTNNFYKNGSFFMGSFMRRLDNNAYFFNGESLDGESTLGAAGITTTTNSRIAALERTSLSSYWNGTISYMLIYNRSLTQGEISANLAYIKEQVVNRGIILPSATNVYFWYPYHGTIYTDNTTAPDGTPTADRFVEGDIVYEYPANDHNVGTQALTLLDNTDYVFSVYLKPAGRTQADLMIHGQNGIWNNAIFDISAGTFLSTTGGNFTNPTITPENDDWYRVSVNYNPGSGVTTPTWIAIFPCYNNGMGYDGDGVSGIYIWGAQLEKGTTATQYKVTTTAAIPDVSSWLWGFGDGGDSTDQNPFYTYNTSGIFDVSLEATNIDGSDTETKLGYINVGDAPTSFNTSYVSCYNRTGNLSLYLQNSGPDWLEYFWNVSANITRVSIDSRLITDFDNATTSILIPDLSQGQNHTARIYNETEYGELICFLNIPVTTTPIPMYPVTSNTPETLSGYWWVIALLLLVVVVVFKKW